MSLGVHISFQIRVFLEYMPRNGIAGSNGRLQQYLNQELPDVQTGFRKGRGTREQIANIH